MSSPVFEVRRRKFSGTSDTPIIEDVRHSLEDTGGFLDVIRSNSELNEVRPREILEITVREDMLTVEDAARFLVVVQSEVPDDMPIGLPYEVLLELLGDDADKFCLYEDDWSRTEGKLIRRAVFINGRTFVPFIDSWSSEIHLVECEPVALYEKVKPKFTALAGIGFTEEDSMVSGYEGEEVGLISDEVAIWYTWHDEAPDEVLIFRQDVERHTNMVLELMTMQFRPFMSKIMVEGLIGHLPEEFGDEIPETWVEDEGSWTAITSLVLSPLLTSESPRSSIRQAILDVLLDSRRGENFEASLAEYIDSVVDSDSLEHEKRLARQQRFIAEVTKWSN
jgi:hypothetical protein